ncbi:glycosyltransferase family 2 protein [Patescibacteria group bacterium]|nr:glycosyltransferase family 2 protein [Patescibacteria group bacterium]
MIKEALKSIYHYLLISKSGLFDKKYYLEAYPDVRRADVDPLIHFIKYGWSENRNPSKDFNTKSYYNNYQDVRREKINPLIHYIKFGRAEGRIPNKEIEQKLNDYSDWIKQYDTLTFADRELICSQIESFEYKPLISILMPVYNTPEQYLREAIESVFAQLYTNWELCIADDASTDSRVIKIIKEYDNKDSRVKVVYRESNGHISAASNSALALCSGEFVGLLDHDDTISEHALYLVVNEINDYPAADIIYNDEDKIDENGKRFDPYFKPDWNPDLFTSQNFISHFGVYRKSLIREVGGFREGLEGAQDWDLAMRISENIPSSHIRHIPYISYHWRAIVGSTAKRVEEKSYVADSQYNTLNSHFDRLGINVEILQSKGGFWRVKYTLPEPRPLVSIIIPTKNRADLLSKCVDSILTKTLYDKFEILIINNQSDAPETLEYFDLICKNDKVKILDYDKPFNYSAINNFGVQHAKGEIIVMLNNDIEIISTLWLNEMVSQSSRPEIGAVGAKLYYPNGLIQHAGVVLGIGGIAGHVYANKPNEFPGQMRRAYLTQNYSAVTGACMTIEKKKFQEIGGLDEKNLAIAFNDIDFCIRLLMSGYQNFWSPYVELYHYESSSRGYEDTIEKQIRFKSESDYMLEKWGPLLAADPAYNLNLTLDRQDFSLAFPPRVKKPWKVIEHD